MSNPYERTDSIFAAYLRRLGLLAPPPPNLAILTQLMACHMQAVPFENLDIVYGTPRGLCTENALLKVAVHSRGGICYELNEAFRALLDHLGFSVRRIEARVWQAAGQRFGAPFDHLALIVALPDGDFLVDVGYGDSNRAPLRIPQDQTHDVSGAYCLAPVRDGILCLSSASRPLYEMTLVTQSLQAFASMSRYHQTSADSIFAKGLICTRATSTGRVTLSRESLITVVGDRRTEIPVPNLSTVLREHFAISDGGGAYLG